MIRAPYGPAHGPLGFPMTDRVARALDAVLGALPKSPEHAYRHLVVTKAPTELSPGERSDVSWVSTECVDRTGEVVRAQGMDDAQFQLNPVVTLGHNYDLPPVGRSLWRRRVRDGAPPAGTVGVKAKTHYPPRPAGWPAGEPWLPDNVFALVQAGLLQGKSIGFLPLEAHVPDPAEAEANGWGDGVRLVIDRWLLLEYACVTLPANQEALVEAVSKGDLELPASLRTALAVPEPAPRVVPFTPLEEVERAVRRAAGRVDVAALVRQALERARGRV
jgi:hypothetical protein